MVKCMKKIHFQVTGCLGIEPIISCYNLSFPVKVVYTYNANQSWPSTFIFAGTFSGLMSPSASDADELLTRGPAPDLTGVEATSVTR